MFNKKELKLVEKIYSKVRFPVFGTDCYAYWFTDFKENRFNY